MLWQVIVNPSSLNSFLIMTNEDQNISEVNLVQFLVLTFLSVIILFDKIPVLVDALNKTYNYRLYDGFGDAIKDFIYFILAAIVLATMKYRKNKADFIVVLIFTIGLMLLISVLGVYNFILLTTFALTLIFYMTCSYIAKVKHSKKINQ